MLPSPQEASPREGGIPIALHRLRALIATQLAAPPALAAEVAKAAQAAGLVTAGQWQQGSPGWQAAWQAITGVWASKWNERAWLSRRARGVRDADLFMACLLQQVRCMVIGRQNLGLECQHSIHAGHASCPKACRTLFRWAAVGWGMPDCGDKVWSCTG